MAETHTQSALSAKPDDAFYAGMFADLESSGTHYTAGQQASLRQKIDGQLDDNIVQAGANGLLKILHMLIASLQDFFGSNPQHHSASLGENADYNNRLSDLMVAERKALAVNHALRNAGVAESDAEKISGVSDTGAEPQAINHNIMALLAAPLNLPYGTSTSLNRNFDVVATTLPSPITPAGTFNPSQRGTQALTPQG